MEIQIEGIEDPSDALDLAEVLHGYQREASVLQSLCVHVVRSPRLKISLEQIFEMERMALGFIIKDLEDGAHGKAGG